MPDKLSVLPAFSFRNFSSEESEFSRLGDDHFIIAGEPDRQSSGVVDSSHIDVEHQLAHRSDVAHDLDVGGVPDILFAGHLGAELFDQLPVVGIVELVAVSPDVEDSERIVALEKSVGDLKKFRVAVVAGGVPEQEVIRKTQFLGGNSGAAVNDSEGGDAVYNIAVDGAEGVGHSGNGITADFFKVAAVFPDFVDDLVEVAALKEDQILKCFVAVVKINKYNWMKNLTRSKAVAE